MFLRLLPIPDSLLLFFSLDFFTKMASTLTCICHIAAVKFLPVAHLHIAPYFKVSTEMDLIVLPSMFAKGTPIQRITCWLNVCPSLVFESCFLQRFQDGFQKTNNKMPQNSETQQLRE